MNFIHLRNHTEYSLCQGAIRIKELVDKVKEFNMPAVGITDSSNLFGALEFSMATSNEGIQPIIGSEVLVDAKEYLGINSIQSNLDKDKSLCKLILIASTDEGYLDLMALVSESFLQRESGVSPHIKISSLSEKSKGLICLSGGVEGVLGRIIQNGQDDKIAPYIKKMKELFPGDNFYMELLRHGMKEEIKLEQDFIDIAYEYNLPIVATNDCYFLTKDMYEAQDALSCIAEGRYIIEKDRKRLTTEHYFKSQEEMIELFKDIPEAIENTINIARKCSTMAHKREPTLPHFGLPEGVTEEEQLKKEAERGLKERLQIKFKNEDIVDSIKQQEIRIQYKKRMEYELSVINQMGFPGYFLIVSDFIIWSKKNDIPVGPGRGSGAGSVVAWSLKITDLDPIRFGLFFERFLNPERISMPDFDIDFCQRGRGDVIRYVQEKYGRDMVGQIITFGKLQAKAVLKDVGRVLQMSYNEVDKICKLIPFNAVEAVTLDKAISMDKDLQAKIESDDQIQYLVNIARKLEGINRHSSTHAAGVVIGDKPLHQICGLHKDEGGEDDMPTIQYTMKYAEMVGLVKFDFLGLKTLTTIKDAVELSYQRTGEKLDISNIRLDDEETFKMLSTGDSIGVFQIESSGMRSMLRQIRPDKIEEIFALISLYRPGPMDNIPTYIARKHGREKSIEYPHNLLKDSLEETYGIIVYQEQVMEAARALAGYTLASADLLRKAMGKKIKKDMDKQRVMFVKGCKKTNNMSESEANEIFDLIAKFAGYGFNKAHAASYSMISYQTAYLKKHFPVEFVVATINMEIHDTDKINFYLQDAKAHGIKILPPDINESEVYFTVELINADEDEKVECKVKKYDEKTGKEIAIRFGLGAIKAVGLKIMQDVVKERKNEGKFKDIFDYCERMGSKVVNKKSMEALSASGALDSIHENRCQIFESSEILSRYASIVEEEKNSNQISLFGGNDDDDIHKPRLASMDDWIGGDKLHKEFDAFGFFLNEHPLDAIKKELDERAFSYVSELDDDSIPNSSKIRLAGVVSDIKHRTGGRGRYAYLYITDPTGLAETCIFNEDLITENRDMLVVGCQVALVCSVRKDDGGTRILVNEINDLRKFIKRKKPGGSQKIIIEEKRRNGKEFWKNKEKSDASNDVVVLSRIEKPVVYKSVEIIIQKDKGFSEINDILKRAVPRDEIQTTERTEIFIVIKGGEKQTKISLGKNFIISNKIERKRLESIQTIEKLVFS
ncbi:DNA polymerase III subunit alpha [Pseudomonadota bacterium]